MAATFVENVRQKFAGELSGDEARLADNLRRSMRATLNGDQSFAAEMLVVWGMLNQLRPYRYDVDAAVASGTFEPVLPTPAKRGALEALTSDEKRFLGDADGLIDWVTRNGVSFDTVLAILGHDVGEISRHDFSLEKTLADFVVPKVTGWEKRNVDSMNLTDDAVYAEGSLAESISPRRGVLHLPGPLFRP